MSCILILIDVKKINFLHCCLKLMIQYGYMETKDKCMKIEWGRAEFSVLKNRKHMQLNQIELE